MQRMHTQMPLTTTHCRYTHAAPLYGCVGLCTRVRVCRARFKKISKELILRG